MIIEAVTRLRGSSQRPRLLVWLIHTFLGGWQALKLPRSTGEKVQQSRQRG